MAPRPLIAGNWKMNGLAKDGLALADGLARLMRAGGGAPADLLICPSATLLRAVAERVAGSGLLVGGQDCHGKTSGAHTGDISAGMLADAGASHVLSGHSERRADHGESDATVRAKAEAAVAAGLIAIVCVGETEAERNRGATLDTVGRQLAGSLPAAAHAANTVVAYEPVWAIGTGRTPTVAEVAEVHCFLRARLVERFADGAGFRILYGGSVKPENAAELLAVADVNGALVGGASLKADGFWAIRMACPTAT
ncbi:MAG: triose-phosphate isomerase [Alphaproteobacteria bacterium]|nr:triose-phosphate isomerase [Alphaproteobacteria bacterium]